MFIWRGITLVFLLPIAWSAKILVTAPFAGSHLSSIWNVAYVLADSGHDVTFISLEKGSLDNFKHPNITGYVMKDNVWEKDALRVAMNERCNNPVAQQHSDHMLEKTAQHKGCIEVWSQAYNICASAYRSTEFEDILERNKFDLIIPQSTEFIYLSVIAAARKIPTMFFVPSFFSMPALIHGNYPLLLSSHPGIIHDRNLSEKPSFLHRFRKITGLPRFVGFFSEPRKYLKANLDKYGVTEKEAQATTQLFLINDHPAFTYPNYLPPYVLNVGAMKHLEYEPKPLDDALLQFIGSNTDPLVYMSFGSFLEPNFKWTQIMIAALGALKVKVILKLNDKSVALPKNFLAMGWVPQVDLLASGKVDLFISHCGNNGRIESAYYNVPVLCIPLFAEQLLNSEVVKFKKFGDAFLRHEIIDENTAVEKVTLMLERRKEFKANLEAMSYVVKNDPTRSKDMLLFYIDYIKRYGSLDYLHNPVLRKQATWEVLNADVICLILGGLLSVVAMILFMLFRCFGKRQDVNQTKKQN